MHFDDAFYTDEADLAFDARRTAHVNDYLIGVVRSEDERLQASQVAHDSTYSWEARDGAVHLIR